MDGDQNNISISNGEELNKLSIGNITWKTWVSTGLTVVASVNEILMVSGIDTPLSKISNDTLTTVLTVGFLVAVRAYSWWHNNSITKKAQAADKNYNLSNKK